MFCPWTFIFFFKVQLSTKYYVSLFQQLVGNSNKATVVVNWLSTPFAAQYVRIVPKAYNNGMCMRVDLFACEDCKYCALKTKQVFRFLGH